MIYSETVGEGRRRKETMWTRNEMDWNRNDTTWEARQGKALDNHLDRI